MVTPFANWYQSFEDRRNKNNDIYSLKVNKRLKDVEIKIVSRQAFVNCKLRMERKVEVQRKVMSIENE